MDVIIIGSGPAAYTAGIYAVRSGLSTLILEGSSFVGQLMTTTDVFNFPGFPNGIGGFELMSNMRSQQSNLGCSLLEQKVISITNQPLDQDPLHQQSSDQQPLDQQPSAQQPLDQPSDHQVTMKRILTYIDLK